MLSLTNIFRKFAAACIILSTISLLIPFMILYENQQSKKSVIANLTPAILLVSEIIIMLSNAIFMFLIITYTFHGNAPFYDTNFLNRNLKLLVTIHFSSVIFYIITLMRVLDLIPSLGPNSSFGIIITTFVSNEILLIYLILAGVITIKVIFLLLFIILIRI